MFSGVIEAKGKITHLINNPGTVLISISCPPEFNDLQPGHSICVNGVCLTVENIFDSQIEFCLAPETLKVTGWSANNLLGQDVNLERSLQFGGRVHGHLVTGHVECLIEVKMSEDIGASRLLSIELPQVSGQYVVPKGSVALNGVSLTVNDVEENLFTVCLIPETLKRTNLSALKVGDKINFESDYLIRAAGRQWQ